MDGSRLHRKIPLDSTLLSIPSLTARQDEGIRASRVVKGEVGPIHRKGSLGYALEEHRLEGRTPLDVVQFLSRSWSSSSLQDFQMIAQSLDCGLELKLVDGCDKKEERDRKGEDASMCGNVPTVDMMRTNRVMNWMRGKLCSSKTQVRRKEELRLHAAMSVAGVAAAIAAFSAKSAIGNMTDKTKLATAAAAALVAAQCADVAELMGANRQHVASIISSSLSVATPTDILTLTAAAATSLRGATTTKGRLSIEKDRQTPTSCKRSKDLDFIFNKEILARGAELPTRVKNGKTQLKIVQIFDKPSLVVLRVHSKHLGGAFITSKDYSIVEVTNESMGGGEGTCFTDEGDVYCFICVKTTQGDIHITLKDEEGCRLWADTISQLLFLSRQAPTH